MSVPEEMKRDGTRGDLGDVAVRVIGGRRSYTYQTHTHYDA